MLSQESYRFFYQTFLGYQKLYLAISQNWNKPSGKTKLPLFLLFLLNVYMACSAVRNRRRWVDHTYYTGWINLSHFGGAVRRGDNFPTFVGKREWTLKGEALISLLKYPNSIYSTLSPALGEGGTWKGDIWAPTSWFDMFPYPKPKGAGRNWTPMTCYDHIFMS